METPFDRRVAALTEVQKARNEQGGDLQGVQILLRGAGVRDDKIAEVTANPSFVALIKANPDLVTQLAKQFPASYVNTYYESRAQYGFSPIGSETSAGGPDAMATNISMQGPTTSASGAMEFPGGVLVDLAQQQVLFPPNNASVMGSPAWMAQIPQWNEQKKETWSKTLKQMGYIETKDVDLATFTDALALYHKNRYLYGGGKPVDLSAGGGAAKVGKDEFGGLLNPAVLDTEVRSYHQEIFGANDEPSEEELARGRKFLQRTALRLANQKGMDPASAASVASARAQERFRQDPATKKWQDLDETDTSLHDSFVNLFQVLSS